MKNLSYSLNFYRPINKNKNTYVNHSRTHYDKRIKLTVSVYLKVVNDSFVTWHSNAHALLDYHKRGTWKRNIKRGVMPLGTAQMAPVQTENTKKYWRVITSNSQVVSTFFVMGRYIINCFQEQMCYNAGCTLNRVSV